jgi:TfoX/Sxy family transcriptional regulator of competence genes
MSKWAKSPPELVARFGRVVPEGKGVERRPMFGYPAAFVNGNMFAGLWQDQMILRLDEKSRAEIGAPPFEPMKGRPMKEYVSVPAAILGDETSLASWARRSLAYASKLKPKAKKKSKK